MDKRGEWTGGGGGTTPVTQRLQLCTWGGGGEGAQVPLCSCTTAETHGVSCRPPVVHWAESAEGSGGGCCLCALLRFRARQRQDPHPPPSSLGAVEGAVCASTWHGWPICRVVGDTIEPPMGGLGASRPTSKSKSKPPPPPHTHTLRYNQKQKCERETIILLQNRCSGSHGTCSWQLPVQKQNELKYTPHTHTHT